MYPWRSKRQKDIELISCPNGLNACRFLSFSKIRSPRPVFRDLLMGYGADDQEHFKEVQRRSSSVSQCLFRLLNSDHEFSGVAVDIASFSARNKMNSNLRFCSLSLCWVITVGIWVALALSHPQDHGTYRRSFSIRSTWVIIILRQQYRLQPSWSMASLNHVVRTELKHISKIEAYPSGTPSSSNCKYRSHRSPTTYKKLTEEPQHIHYGSYLSARETTDGNNHFVWPCRRKGRWKMNE